MIDETLRIRSFVACADTRLRRAIAALLATTEDIEVVGEASDGWHAVEGVRLVQPDRCRDSGATKGHHQAVVIQKYYGSIDKKLTSGSAFLLCQNRHFAR